LRVAGLVTFDRTRNATSASSRETTTVTMIVVTCAADPFGR